MNIAPITKDELYVLLQEQLRITVDDKAQSITFVRKCDGRRKLKINSLVYRSQIPQEAFSFDPYIVSLMLLINLVHQNELAPARGGTVERARKFFHWNELVIMDCIRVLVTNPQHGGKLTVIEFK